MTYLLPVAQPPRLSLWRQPIVSFGLSTLAERQVGQQDLFFLVELLMFSEEHARLVFGREVKRDLARHLTERQLQFGLVPWDNHLMSGLVGLNVSAALRAHLRRRLRLLNSTSRATNPSLLALVLHEDLRLEPGQEAELNYELEPYALHTRMAVDDIFEYEPVSNTLTLQESA